MDIPIHSKQDLGTIHYPKSIAELSESKGLFSFSFYVREDGSLSFQSELSSVYDQRRIKDVQMYLSGLLFYLQLSNSEPFKDWSYLVYTDAFSLKKILYYKDSTLEQMQKDFIESRNIHPSKVEERTILFLEETKIIQDVITNIFKFPNVHFVVVDISRHERKRGEVVGPILRCMRHRAPFDFPNNLVCIRDLDTLFEFTLKRDRRTESEISSFLNGVNEENKPKFVEERQAKFRKHLFDWESKFLESIPSIQKEKKSDPLVIVISYEQRLWHVNTNDVGNKRKAPFGLCACFVNIVPPVKVFQTMELWDTFMDWLEPRNKKIGNLSMFDLETLHHKHKNSVASSNPFFLTYNKPTKEEGDAHQQFVEERYKGRVANDKRREKFTRFTKAKRNDVFHVFSNNADTAKIGRDEQYLIFLLSPRCIEELFFFEFNLDGYAKNFVKVESMFERHKEQLAAFQQAIANNFKGGSKTRKQRKH